MPGIHILSVVVFLLNSTVRDDNINASSPCVSDSEMVKAVETVLAWDDAVAAPLIGIAVRKGIVTLSGTVDNMLSRDRAEVLVRSLKGVRAINNRISIKPVLRNNGRIQSNIKNAISSDPMGQRLAVKVSVVKGIAVLNGEVESYSEKIMAENIAKRVAGVTGIDNRIKIVFKEKKSDSAITAEIKNRFDVDQMLHREEIKAVVKNGRVQLFGNVGTIQEYAAACLKVEQIIGVVNVDASGLKVTEEVQCRHDATTGLQASNEKMELTLEDVFHYSPRLLPYIIEFTVDSGRVRLRGNVDNLLSKKTAERRAAEVIGVREIINDIIVKPSPIRKDWELENDIEHALKWDPFVQRHDIDLWVKNGVVHLNGKVDNEFERQQAEEVVSVIKGVVAIKNNLSKHERIWQRKSDDDIEFEVLRRLRWEGNVDESKLGVKVADGIVTLSGEVKNLKEYRNALNCVFSGGAKGVRMEIEVRGDNGYFGMNPQFYPTGYDSIRTFGVVIPF